MRTNAQRMLGLMVMAAMAFGFVAACGGDDDDDGSNNDTAATATSGSPDGTGSTAETGTPTTAAASPTSDSGSDGGSDNGGAGLAVLQQTANSLDAGTYYLVYSVTGTSVNGTFTFASEPPSSLLALDGTLSGESGIFSIINLEDATYFCNGTPGEEMCLKLATGNTSAIPFTVPTAFDVNTFLGNVLDEPGVSAHQIDSRTIAGIDADCYDVTSTNGDSGSFCVGDNVILSMESDIDGEHYEMEATQAETDPAKIEITVPDYPVTDMTSLGN